MASLELGKSIMKCKPFVCALKTNQKSIRCDFCFKSICKPLKCLNCLEYWYCSDLCRDMDFGCHRFECNTNLREIIEDKCNDPKVREESDWSKFKDFDEFVTQTLLLLRILFKLKSDPKSASNELLLANGLRVSYDDIIAPNCQQMHRVWDLDEEEENDSVHHLIDEVTYNFGAWLSVVRQILDLDFIKTSFGTVSEDVLLRAFRIVVRYTLYVCDTTFLNEIGKAIYVEMCFVTHSCVPNCGPLFDGNNTLDLRLLDNRVTDFSQLRYDYQIEMTGFSAQELVDSLFMRNIQCNCKICLNPKQYSVNFHKILTNANLKYGNWPPIDYCQAMIVPINETLESFTKIYGKFHPWITALLLWGFRVELILFNSNDCDVTNDQLFNTFKRLEEALFVTHGSDHVWYQKLVSIENNLRNFIDSNQTNNELTKDYPIIDSTIEQIIPKLIIDQKLA